MVGVRYVYNETSNRGFYTGSDGGRVIRLIPT